MKDMMAGFELYQPADVDDAIHCSTDTAVADGNSLEATTPSTGSRTEERGPTRSST